MKKRLRRYLMACVFSYVTDELEKIAGLCGVKVELITYKFHGGA